MSIVPVNDTTVNVTWNKPVNATGISEYYILVQRRSGEKLVNAIVPAVDTLSQYQVGNLCELTTNVKDYNYYSFISLCTYILAPQVPYTVIVTASNTNDQGPPVSLDFFSKEGGQLI